jgi:hypothetical protein
MKTAHGSLKQHLVGGLALGRAQLLKLAEEDVVQRERLSNLPSCPALQLGTSFITLYKSFGSKVDTCSECSVIVTGVCKSAALAANASSLKHTMPILTIMTWQKKQQPQVTTSNKQQAHLACSADYAAPLVYSYQSCAQHEPLKQANKAS